MTAPLSALSRRSALAGLVLGLLMPCAAAAQDGGLYEAVADPDAAFLRVIAAKGSPAFVQTTSFDGLDTGISPYVTIAEAGEVHVSAGTVEATVTVAPGSWQSFVVGPDGTGKLVADKPQASPAQADVALYNLSDLPAVDLFVPAAKAVALKAVPLGDAASVALKAPLTLDFAVQDKDVVLASVAGVELKRRDGVTFVFRGSSGAYELVAVPNSVSK